MTSERYCSAAADWARGPAMRCTRLARCRRAMSVSRDHSTRRPFAVPGQFQLKVSFVRLSIFESSLQTRQSLELLENSNDI